MLSISLPKALFIHLLHIGGRHPNRTGTPVTGSICFLDSLKPSLNYLPYGVAGLESNQLIIVLQTIEFPLFYCDVLIYKSLCLVIYHHMHDSIFNNLNILGEKKMFKDGSNRVCYLINCSYCKIPSYHPRYAVLKSIKKRKLLFFCNQNCSKQYNNKSQTFLCETCGVSVTKQLCQIKITKHHFCSRNCAAIYHNTHKTNGTRRSKLEKYLESNIQINFPTLNCLYNNVKIIGSELDIFIPSLNLAIQINGPLHFKPIYGIVKLNRIIELDNIKRQICQQLNIKLIEIDVSKDSYFAKTKDTRWLEVKSIIELSLKEKL